MRLRNCLSLSSPPPKLNLGSGLVTPEGFHNIDILPGPQVHTVMDIDHDPLPFPDESVNAVLASHVVEHLAHVERVFGEIHRVLKVGGIFEMYVPYGKYGLKSTIGHIRSIWPVMGRHLGIIVDERQSRGLSWELITSEISERALPLSWHWKHYFGIQPNMGRKAELHMALKKVSREQFESRMAAGSRSPWRTLLRRVL